MEKCAECVYDVRNPDVCERCGTPRGEVMNETIPGVMPEMLASMLSNGLKCPLCGRDVPHSHSPEEIIIYRNGVKYGSSLRGETEQLGRVQAALKEATQALRQVGDDYPGSSCHEWCHRQADTAELKARYP